MENSTFTEKGLGKKEFLLDDDFDQVLNKLDKMEFSAVTEGLGFHTNKTASTQTIMKASTQSFKPAQPLKSTSLTPPPLPSHKPTAVKEIKKEELLLQAPMVTVFMAWLTDLFFVTLFFASNLALLILVSGIELKEFFKILPVAEITLYCLMMFVSYYLFYFTILDTKSSATIGKALFRLTLKHKSGSDLTLNTKLTRALISFFSIPLLGIPYIFNMHELLTNTILVKKNHE